jgi:hypothetical protein
LVVHSWLATITEKIDMSLSNTIKESKEAHDYREKKANTTEGWLDKKTKTNEGRLDKKTKTTEGQ